MRKYGWLGHTLRKLKRRIMPKTTEMESTKKSKGRMTGYNLYRRTITEESKNSMAQLKSALNETPVERIYKHPNKHKVNCNNTINIFN